MAAGVATAPPCLGFTGKLPSRGDFVSIGLPTSFLKRWQAWTDAAMAASRAALGADWLPAWLSAPVWHFTLPAGVCGPDALRGLMLPSVDRANRHYPLTIAAMFPDAATAPGALTEASWHEAAAAIGCRALAEDLTPEQLAAALAQLPPAPAAPPSGPADWWTDGSPFVPPSRQNQPGLPLPDNFAAMIRANTHR